MKNLPTGIQNITEILNGNFVYVDKTGLAHKLITSGKHYFISRPRRFGKSLFVSTLKQIFKGNRGLFKGCAINNCNYNWSEHPILHLDFAQISAHNCAALKADLKDVLLELADRYGEPLEGPSLQAQLRRLIKTLAQKHGKVVILVDEYDKPIINNLKNIELAEANRDLLKEVFETLKSLDEYIKFTFITGVSKFSQVSLFSGPNYLKDITMVDSYAEMFGYTDNEVRECFANHIKRIANKRLDLGVKATEEDVIDEIRTWYNGYRFSKDPISVYNPFSTLNFMESGYAEGYWYSSGTPSFLIDEIKKHPQSAIPLSGATASKSDLMDISDFAKIDVTALMYQTGYLTVQDYTSSGLYRLGFPNEEVRQAFLGSLVRCFTDIAPGKATKYQELFETKDLGQFFEKIKSFIASFPPHLFTKATESTYQGMLLAILKGMGFDVHAEHYTNLGRIDLVIETSNITYILECKLDKSAEAALAQIENKKYFERSTQNEKSIGLIGINFSSRDRNISQWEGKLISHSGDFLHKL